MAHTPTTTKDRKRLRPPRRAAARGRPKAAHRWIAFPAPRAEIVPRPLGQGRWSRWLKGAIALMAWAALYASLAPIARTFTSACCA